MKIAVCVKRVAILGDEVEFTDGGRAVDPDYCDFALNEWDTYAVEEGLRLRDASGGGEVDVVTVGDDESDDVLRRCLAMGADRAIRVWSDELSGADPVTVARALASALRPEAPDLVLAGVQSSDSVQGATGSALAELLGLPLVAVVRRLDLQPPGSARVERELEAGVVEVVETQLPAVLTIQTGINEPRYLTLRALQAARDREIELVEPGPLGAPAYRIRRMEVPSRERAEMIEGNPAAIARRLLEVVQNVVPR